MTTTHVQDPSPVEVPLDTITTLIEKRAFCTISTVSPAGRPHAAGVAYSLVGRNIWFNTQASSRKARNIAANEYLAMVIPVRRVPVGAPPSTIQFQSTGRIVSVDDPEVAELVKNGHLGDITSHGELELPDSCFVKVELPTRIFTYGLGMSILQLAKNPLAASGVAIAPS